MSSLPVLKFGNLKTLPKIFFSGTSGPISTNVCSIGDSGPIIVYSNDGPRLTLIYFVARSNFVRNLGFSIEKSENSGLFKKNYAACDQKVGRCRQLIKLMKVCDY